MPASRFGRLVFDPTLSQQNDLDAPKVNVSRCDDNHSLLTALIIVVIDKGIEPIRIFLGSLWENGHINQFNETTRRAVLNAEWHATIE